MFSVLSMLSMLPPDRCIGGGGEGQQACYVNGGGGGAIA